MDVGFLEEEDDRLASSYPAGAAECLTELVPETDAEEEKVSAHLPAPPVLCPLLLTTNGQSPIH